MKKCKKSRQDNRAAPSLSDVTPLNETAPHGRRELCTLSSAQPLVIIVIIIFGQIIIIIIIITLSKYNSCLLYTSPSPRD